MWRGPALVTVVRDLGCLVLPGAAFILEALKDKPSVELLILYMALLAFPGLSASWFLVRHGGGGGGTALPPSQPPPPPAVPPASSSSSSPGIEGGTG